MDVLTRVVLIVCAVIVALSLLWIAGEQHYQSCIEGQVAKGGGAPAMWGDDDSSLFSPDVNTKKCSRIPF